MIEINQLLFEQYDALVKRQGELRQLGKHVSEYAEVMQQMEAIDEQLEPLGLVFDYYYGVLVLRRCNDLPGNHEAE